MSRPLLSKVILISSLMLGAALWTSTLHAAPLCHEVLSSGSAAYQHDLAAAIQHMAEMRLQLDLQKGQGQKSMTHKMLEQNYLKKLQELSQKLNIDINEVRQMIRTKIPTLQAKAEQKEETVREERQQQEQTISTSQYELKGTVKDLDFGTSFHGIAELVPGKTMLLHSARYLQLMDLKTKENFLIGDEIFAADLNSHAGTVFTISEKAVLKIYSLPDIKKPKEVALIAPKGVDLKDMKEVMAVNSSGSKVAVAVLNEVLIFDTSAGKLVDRITPDPDRELPTIYLGFHSEKELIISAGTVVMKRNVETKETEQQTLPGRANVTQLSVDPHSQQVIAMTYNKKSEKETWTFDVQNMNSPAVKSARPFSGSSYVAGSANLIALTDTNGTVSLYKRDNLDTAIFDFSDYYNQDNRNVPWNYTFSADGKKVFIPYRRAGSRDEGFDVWERSAN
jgi:hypothetical protein